MKLAIIALIGSSSAIQANRSAKWQRYQNAKWSRYQMAQIQGREPYSNELSNGDVSDDKQVVDVDNGKYDIADDYGFVNSWKRDGSSGLEQQKRIRLNQMRNRELPSNEVANGDVSENKQLEDQDDVNDDIADNNGFVNQWKNDGDIAQIRSIRLNQMRNREVPSNEVANGDVSENKELEDQDDVNDIIADNNGFVNQWKNDGDIAQIRSSRPPFSLAQIQNMREIQFLQRQNQMHMAQMQMRNRDIYSNELANGDRSDDKQLEDQDDVNDDIADNNGFVNQWKNTGDIAQISSTDDWNSDVGTYAGQKTRNYATPYRTHNGQPNLDAFWNENHIMSGSMGTVPRMDGDQPLRNSPDYVAINDDLYSNQLANGDKDDDKELEKEDDMEDAIVDYQGHTNRGYGSTLPSTYFANNHIMSGSMGTVPREVGPMRNSLVGLEDIYSNELANGDVSDDKEVESEMDVDDAIVDTQGQTNAGYGSAVPTAYFEANHIFDGQHIQVPRMDGPQALRNSPNYLQLESTLV